VDTELKEEITVLFVLFRDGHCPAYLYGSEGCLSVLS
jgi:hypothetical protein